MFLSVFATLRNKTFTVKKNHLKHTCKSYPVFTMTPRTTRENKVQKKNGAPLQCQAPWAATLQFTIEPGAPPSPTSGETHGSMLEHPWKDGENVPTVDGSEIR